MNAAERRTIREVARLVLVGDRSTAAAKLRALGADPRRDVFGPKPTRQLVLSFMSFRCERLGVESMSAHVCVTRQKVTDLQRTKQTSRGQSSDYPRCDSRSCEVGRRIRERLDAHARETWTGAGFGGRFARGRENADASKQEAARRRQEAEGRLDAPRILDIDPDPADE
jgi:hypothetical protein